MKPNTQFRLNSMPRLFISHQDLERIKYVVDLAPKEAQWFSRIEKVKTKSTVYYRIYDMFIPEQYCSSAEVESDPMMMVKFYKELKEKHGMEGTNEIMKNMTVWSHSHHNMGVSPSGQDLNQFAENIENAKKANQKAPQVMFIFNKKDQYHMKLWDCETEIIYENLQLEVLPYDFSYLDDEAKTKFKKKKIKATKSKKQYIHKNNTRASWDFLEWGLEESEENENNFSNSPYSLISDYINIGLSTYPSISSLMNKYDRKNKRAFLEQLIKDLSMEEIQLFHIMLDLDTSLLLDFETDSNYKIEDQFEDILGDIHALERENNEIAAILVFIKVLQDEVIDRLSVIEEFQSILDDDSSYLITSTY